MRLLIIFLALVFAGKALSERNDFIVSDIRVEGLQRVSAGSVFSSFPVTVGEKIDRRDLAQATRELFKSGLFTDIRLGREGDVLVVTVVERPSISKIDIEGNKNLPTEDLLIGLKSAGLSEGQVFQRSTLERLELEILRSYIAQGRYNAIVDAEVEELPRNRVRIAIDIKEGPIAAISHINFVGNEAFSDEELSELMELQTSGMWTWISGKDKYSKQKLNGDLEKVRSHYLDNGHIRFSIESTQVSISPDKEQVFITVNVDEGSQYTIKDIKLKGNLIVPEEDLRKLIYIEPGDIFSRQVLTFTSDIISKRLGNDGYTFASVNAIPEPHDDGTATVTFYVDPGRRSYVRRINFIGNTNTSDEVLRQEMLQMEAAAASTDRIEASKSRLERLGFFKEVSVETPLVPGTNDHIDVNYSVEEQPTGSLSASLGFSQNSGLLIGLNVAEKNFFGTGRRVSFGVNRSQSVKSANFSYTNPYYTIDGVSRGFSLSARETNFEEEDVASYTADSGSAGMNFGYPIDNFSRLNFGVDFNFTKLKVGDEPVEEILDFVEKEGKIFRNYQFTGSWISSTLNRGLFPTRGLSHSLSAKISMPGISDLEFYKVSHKSNFYYPISQSNEWVFRTRTELAYGDGYGSDEELPFFEHYYAGGVGSVRGYRSNSLGLKGTPSDVRFDADPFGGNVLIEAGAELIFPFIFMKDRQSIRSVLFADAGNVFDTNRDFDPEVEELRLSAGLAITWITPIGPLSFSLAETLNEKEGDRVQRFQFLLGQTF